MSEFSCLSSKDLVLIGAILAIQLSEGRDADDVNILGNLLTAVGALLLTINAKEESSQAMVQNNKSNGNSKKSSQ